MTPRQRSAAPGIVTLGHRELMTLRDVAAETEAAAKMIAAIAHTAWMPDTHKVYLLSDETGEPMDGKYNRKDRRVEIDLPNTIATGTAAVMAGRELGLEFYTSLRSIYVLNGTPSLYVAAAQGLVQAAGHHVVVIKSTDFEARVRVRRHNEEDWQEAVWSEQRAKDAGLYPGRDKSAWRMNKRGMLNVRARGEGVRWIGGDVLLGVPLYEELLDADDEAAAPLAITAGPAANGQAQEGEGGEPRTVRRRRSKPPAEPAAPAAAGTVTETAPPQDSARSGPAGGQVPADPGAAERPIRDGQQRRIKQLVRQLGYNISTDAGRADAYNLLGGWLEPPRKIDTTGTLTEADARIILPKLEALLGMGAQAAGGEDRGGDDPGPPDEEPR